MLRRSFSSTTDSAVRKAIAESENPPKPYEQRIFEVTSDPMHRERRLAQLSEPQIRELMEQAVRRRHPNGVTWPHFHRKKND